MKTWIALLTAGMMTGAACAATAQSVAPGVSGKSEGRWEILCQALANGDQKYFLLKRDHSGFSDPRLARADCKYRADPQAGLAIAVVGAETCPFANASTESCTINVPAGERGSFKFTAKNR